MTSDPTLASSEQTPGTAGQSAAARDRQNLRSLHPSALRERLPVEGFREYWYPAIREHSVPRKRPTTVKLVNTDVVFFRGKNGRVAAVGDACPHRGGSLGVGKCEFAGTITCPYHGWTFDENGECLAVLGEGPESRIPGMPEARARTYPTKTFKGLVWVWMGDGEPAPVEEDIPPQFFDEGLQVQYSIQKWKCNWRPACENMLDSHVFYVHRKSLFFLLTPTTLLLNLSGLGPRRPRPRVLKGRSVSYRSDQVAAIRRLSPKDDPGAANGIGNTAGSDAGQARQWPPREGYSEAYPGLDGQRWPRDSWRLPWHRLMDIVLKLRPKADPLISDDEWSNFHLPGLFQVDYQRFLYSRLTVPIDEDTSRIFYFHTTRRGGRLRDYWDTAYFVLFHNWMMNYNFSGQDLDAVEPLHYDTPEHLSATDVFPLTIRRAMVEHARRAPADRG